VMGYPVVDVEAVLIGAGYKESQGSELAYKVSAAMACKEALRAGTGFLLDPIMKVEVFVPEEFMGEVIGDLNARSGKIEAISPKVGVQAIQAIVPLARMFGYSTAVRSATQGRGTFTMQFSHFDRA
jgi:elongation factor G